MDEYEIRAFIMERALLINQSRMSWATRETARRNIANLRKQSRTYRIPIHMRTDVQIYRPEQKIKVKAEPKPRPVVQPKPKPEPKPRVRNQATRPPRENGRRGAGRMSAVRIVETGQTFDSLRDCADTIGGKYQLVSAVLHGSQRRHRGFTFERLENAS